MSKSIYWIVGLVFIIFIAGISYYLGGINSATGDLNSNLDNNYGEVETNKDEVLSQSEAETLVLNKWGGCTPDMCSSVTVEIKVENGQNIVTATYNNLRDDSVNASRKEAVVYYEAGDWVLGESTDTHKCQQGRGHQDFSQELCI
jgi:hypothetical protein